MLHCGIDLIEVARVRAAAEKSSNRFLWRVFTAEEIRYCTSVLNPWPHFAARFAAKEAFYKAVSGTLTTLVWKEVGIRNEPRGRPRFELTGRTASHLAGWQFSLSLSHLRDLAIAQVLAQPPDS